MIHAMLQKRMNYLLLKNKFIKRVSIVMSGTVFAQLMTVISAPILSRLYELSAFGVYSLFMTITALVSVIAALRYELAIVLPKEEEEAAHLLVLSSFFVVLMSAGSLVVILLFGDSIVNGLGIPELKPWLIWIPVSVFATGMYQCLTYWSTRKKQFKRVSIAQILRSTGVSSTQIAAGAAGFGASGIIGGQMIGQVIASSAMGVQTWKDDRSLFKSNIRLSRIKQLSRTYSEFAKFSTPQTLINSVSRNLPILLLAKFYGTEIVGFYAIASRLLQMPVTMISQSISQVLLQKFSVMAHDNKNYDAQVKKLTGVLALIGLIPMALIVVFGPSLFKIILGPNWTEAGEYARWMALWLYLSFINPSTMTMITVLGMQRLLLRYECLLLIFRLAALWGGGLYLSALHSVAVYSIVGAVFNLFLIGLVLKLSKSNAKGYASS